MNAVTVTAHKAGVVRDLGLEETNRLLVAALQDAGFKTVASFGQRVWQRGDVEFVIRVEAVR